MNILFISLGCDKNLADSEEMLGMLVGNGYEITNDESEAEAIVINTCAFIHDAKEESVNSILEMARYKETGQLKALVVTGCLAQRYQKEIIGEIPEVDAVLGTGSWDELIQALDKVFEGEKYLDFQSIDRIPQAEGKRVITTGGHYDYLKIAEGCDKCCTYCIIPKLRGKYRSIPMEKLVAQAEYLVSQGVRELIVVAQETTVYGQDLYGEKSLHILLRKLCRIPGIRWIRILYCYPEEIYPELIQTMKEERKICHYLDLPIQHCNNRILKRMGRRTTKEELIRIVETLRKEIPDIVLRTTLITGFPGETQEEHEELMEFIDAMEFDRLGVFTYSPEEDTPAAEMPDQIPEEAKEERRAIVMEIQKGIAAALCAQEIGKTVEVLVEGRLPEEAVYCGRTRRDAPDIDGMVFFRAEEEAYSGDFVSVHIREAGDYDLMGDVVYADEFAK